MEKYVIFVLCFIVAPALAPPPRTTKQYRGDYVYNRKTDAFYKFHIETVRYYSVQRLCEQEGAQMMVPESNYDIMQLHSMFKQYPDLGNYAWVGNDGQKHESAEEQPIIDLSSNTDGSMGPYSSECQVGTRSGDIETTECYRQFPFICKVAAKDAPYDAHCDVYGKDYRYYSSVRSCYKIPRMPYTWSQAYSECQAEGGHLLVINSEAEHDAIFNLTNTEEKVQGSRVFHFYWAGFRADKPVGNATAVFKTIFNQTLEEAGYAEWAENEPNNAMGREYCGSVFKNDGKLNDYDCTHEVGFICEKELSM
ncbi:hypothetical protein PYW07_003656 [Mythimna separata]|uniref:IML8 n=1 Tax=Mythimna separata TaxID=271217 RepID=A0A8F3C7F2_MYTSE|nr:hypothetical protein PYW07_003656 [Mythimna separata]QWY13105.1 IML8 [Mythimna separata]